ncbi:hypothetical protein A2U01_0077018, partial [Trifolium medium]|nr:hypothetical protein [Trifolium medium]
HRADHSQRRYKTRSSSAQRRWRQNHQGERRLMEAAVERRGRHCDRSMAELAVGGDRIEGGKDKVGVLNYGRGKEQEDGGVVNAGLKHRDDNVS